MADNQCTIDITNKDDMIQVLINECRLSPDMYQEMFPNCYTFPSLEKDDEGFIIHSQKKNYADYSFFDISDGKLNVIHDDKTIPHTVLEETALTLTEVEFDLKLGDNRVCVKNTCHIYPESIKHTPVYDIIVYTDVLFKYIWAYLRHTIFKGLDPQLAGYYDFIISHIPGKDGLHHIKRTHKRDGFSKLKNAVHMFLLKNKAEVSTWRQKYETYDKKDTRVALNFTDIDYAYDENNIYINPKLKPTVEASYIDGSPINSGEPGDIIKLFVENHYDVIREAFPIYKELEIIYKIMCANRIMRRNFVVPQKATLVYVGDIMDSIMFHGGINLQPKNWNIIDMPVIPFKDHPLVKATQKKIDVKVCREAFDNGGFICAFAPKLKIRDCYDNNLKTFHECLEEDK